MATPNTPQTPGSLLEQALVWGVPVAPVFVLMMMVVIYTPSSLPMYQAVSYYLICMLGAALGFFACIFIRTWTPLRRQQFCWGSVAALEVAFVCLCLGFASPERASSAFTILGSLLVGLGTATMLTLWLSFRQTGDLRCEIAKLGVALVTAFVVHTLLGMMEFGDKLFPVFPLLTCIPFSVMARGGTRGDTERGQESASGTRETELEAEGGEPPADYVTAGSIEGAGMQAYEPYEPAPGERRPPREGDAPKAQGISARPCRPPLPTWALQPVEAIVSSLTIAAFGAGFAALGFGGSPSEYGTGLGGVILMLLAIAPRIRRPLSLTGQVAFLLATIGLCSSVLLGGVSPFSTYLAGCIALATWALLNARLKEGTVVAADPREVALSLLWVNVCAACGLALARVLLTGTDASAQSGAISLVCVIACVGFLWQAIALPRSHERSVVPACAPADPGVSEAALSQTFGLSPREAQVACLLLESRSVTYICEVLGLATGTAKTHIQHVYEKAGVHSKSELQLRVDALLGSKGR